MYRSSNLLLFYCQNRRMNTKDLKKTNSRIGDSKRPYTTPKILSREHLEAMAVICSGPTAKADVITCSGGPIGS